MKALLVILTFLIIAFLVVVVFTCSAEAQVVEVFIDNPGAGGMQSNYGIHTLSLDQLYYAYNVDVTTTPGEIRRRKGLINYGANTQALYGAFGYYNSELGHSMVIGVYDHDTVYNVGTFYFTDTFRTNLSFGAINGPNYPYANTYHDWVQVEDMVIHADGMVTPTIYTTSTPKKISQTAMDVTRYTPRVLSMGLEAPGQPRAGLYDSTGPLNGSYQYAFAYKFDTSGGFIYGLPGITSTIVRPVNKCVYLTNIPEADTNYQGTDWLFILRKEINGLADWYLIDSIYRPQDSGTVDMYIDNNPLPYDTTWYYTDGGVDSLLTCDTCGPILYWRERWNGDYQGRWNDWVGVGGNHCEYETDSVTGDYKYWRDDYAFSTDSLMELWENITLSTMSKDDSCILAEVGGAVPIGCYGSFDSVVARFDSIRVDSNGILWVGTADSIPGQPINPNGSDSLNSYCLVSYSRYDPVTRLESPLSPAVKCGYDSSALGIMDTILFRTEAVPSEPRWIRIYQTVINNTIVGGGDTTVWYGTMQVRVGDVLEKTDSVFMIWADTTMANGLDSSDCPGTTDYPYNFFRTILGDVVIQPSYIYDNQIPFSDMDYVSGRLVGIGDPLNPERLYYSEINSWYTNVFNWPPFNYLDLNEGVTGDIIAIERAEGFGQDALNAFKRNAIYLVDIYNGTVELIESNIGAVSRRAVVKYGKMVYFLAPDMRIYVIYGSTVQDISDPIANWIDSLFTDEVTASSSCRAFRLGQSIKFFDTASGLGLSFNTERGLWSLESYGDDSSYVPMGSFTYDSASGGIMSGFPTTVLYSNTTVPLRIESDTTTYDFGDTAHQTAFQTPFFGDGLNLWSLQKLQLTVRSLKRVWLRYGVYNNENTLLISDSIFCGDASMIGPPIVLANPYVNQVIHIGDNIAKYLSVKIYTDPSSAAGQGNDINILDMRLFLRNMGVDNVK